MPPPSGNIFTSRAAPRAPAPPQKSSPRPSPPLRPATLAINVSGVSIEVVTSMMSMPVDSASLCTTRISERDAPPAMYTNRRRAGVSAPPRRAREDAGAVPALAPVAKPPVAPRVAQLAVERAERTEPRACTLPLPPEAPKPALPPAPFPAPAPSSGDPIRGCVTYGNSSTESSPRAASSMMSLSSGVKRARPNSPSPSSSAPRSFRSAAFARRLRPMLTIALRPERLFTATPRCSRLTTVSMSSSERRASFIHP
mmetsp:Transcript_3053/g.12371  ORF Transcript_3053/g.12371 Transcript_3053/m.12371 type:complete len:255 (-) Transcript_3053:1307-2071(-)